MCNFYIMYNLNSYMCVIVITFNCVVHIHWLYSSVYLFLYIHTYIYIYINSQTLEKI